MWQNILRVRSGLHRLKICLVYVRVTSEKGAIETEQTIDVSDKVREVMAGAESSTLSCSRYYHILVKFVCKVCDLRCVQCHMTYGTLRNVCLDQPST